MISDHHAETRNLLVRPAQVAQILRPDTFQAVIDLSLGVTLSRRVLAKGVAQVDEDQVPVAVAALQEWLATGTHPGEVWLRIKLPYWQDDHGRVVAQVWRHDQNLAAYMREQGFGG